jgi:hypothetical protein
MQAKIEEFRLYVAKYLENAERERQAMLPYLKKEEVKEFDSLIANLTKFDRDAIAIYDEVDLIAIRFGVLYEIYSGRVEETAASKKRALTAEHEGITIRREPMKYSSFVISVGYHPEHKLLDIEFTGGKVYRYVDVPESFFTEIKKKNKTRDLNKGLQAFEFVRIA